MRLMTATILVWALLQVLPGPLFCAEPDFNDTVKKFIKVIGNNDRKAIAALVAYPLHREVPLPTVKSSDQFLEVFDEILDDTFLKAITASRVADDWSEMGWRGIMFQNGSLWLDEDGKIRAVNYQTGQGKRKRAELIEADKQRLPASLRNFVEPVLEWETAKYRIRIDQIAENRFRYAVWPVQKKTSELPDLVLSNGTVTYDGSGGNHNYDFKSGEVLYRCFVWTIGGADTASGEIKVYRNKKVVLKQPVLKVISGR